MYTGQLITFKIKDRPNLIAMSLLDLEAEIDTEGLLLIDKRTKEPIGYYERSAGINFEEMLKLLGFTL